MPVFVGSNYRNFEMLKMLKRNASEISEKKKSACKNVQERHEHIFCVLSETQNGQSPAISRLPNKARCDKKKDNKLSKFLDDTRTHDRLFSSWGRPTYRHDLQTIIGDHITSQTQLLAVYTYDTFVLSLSVWKFEIPGMPFLLGGQIPCILLRRR